MEKVKNINPFHRYRSMLVSLSCCVLCVVVCDRIKSGIRIGAGSEHIQYRPFEFDFDFYVDIDVDVDVGDNEQYLSFYIVLYHIISSRRMVLLQHCIVCCVLCVCVVCVVRVL